MAHMAHTGEMQQMQEFIAAVLDKTGEFTDIQPGYHNRGIYAARKGINNDTHVPFLIMTHADTMPEKEFIGELEEATKKGIATAHVLYRYLNDSGPFWRRKPMPDKKDEDEIVYRQKAAYRKEAMDYLPRHVRERLRYLSTDIERNLVPEHSPGKVINYYQPKSPRLEELLQRNRFNDITADYSYSEFGEFPRVRKAEKTKLPETVEETKLFSLDRIQKGSYLVADVIALPVVEASSLEELRLRHLLGRMAHYRPIRKRDAYLVKEMAEKLEPDNQLQGVLDSILCGLYSELTSFLPLYKENIAILSRDGTPLRLTFNYQSRSRPGTGIIHQTEIDLTDSQNPLEGCSCEAFNYGLDCWHRKEARKRVKDLRG